jgi:hypothetical protein
MANVGGIVSGAGSIVGGVLGRNAAKSAASAQAGAAEQGIGEQRRQFDLVQELLKPFVDVGVPALEGQKSLIGLSGAGAQQEAISILENSPLFQSIVRQGEEALLQRASATGGLRGGNIQAALAQFRPEMLRAEIENQYTKLGGLTSLGQQSATGVGTAGQAMANNVSNLLGVQGAARAGGILGANQATQQMIGGLTGQIGGALSQFKLF